LRTPSGGWVVTIKAHAPVGNELIMAEDCARSEWQGGAGSLGSKDRTLH
jgi:hypothetical protein